MKNRWILTKFSFLTVYFPYYFFHPYFYDNILTIFSDQKNTATHYDKFIKPAAVRIGKPSMKFTKI
jgi:hypothetical protein